MKDTFEHLKNLSTEEKRQLLARLLQQEMSASRSYPLSLAQQRMWFLQQWDLSSPLYNISLALHLQGNLQRPLLTRCLEEIVQRHEILRTTFPLLDGLPVQMIHAPAPLALALIDLREQSPVQQQTLLTSLLTAATRQAFDLQQGPLLRLLLLQLAADEHVLLLTIHHIVTDGWSMQIFLDEVSQLYQAFSLGLPSPLPPLPLQYADYAHWQREWLQGEVLERQLGYWKNQLAELPTLELPLDHPRPAILSFEGASFSFALPQTLLQQLQRLSQQEGVTLFMVLLTAFQVLLARYSHQQDIVLGTDIANRNQTEIERMIGFFVNTLVLRTDLSGNPTFREALHRVREVCLDAYTHQDLPFERLVEALQPERDPSRNPLFQVLFALQNEPTSQIELPGLTISELNLGNDLAQFDLMLVIEENGQAGAGICYYNTALFNASTIERMMGYYQTLLRGVVQRPAQSIAAFTLLTEDERVRILYAWNAKHYALPQVSRVSELFEMQAAHAPDAIAIVCEDEHLTYEALNRKAENIAYQLRLANVGPETLIALLGKRENNLLIAILGIFKAGGAYLPLDPSHPPARLKQIVQQSKCQLILASSALALTAQQMLTDDESFQGIRILSIEDLLHAKRFEQDVLDDDKSVPDQLAYVIYTSGSTGVPKGAMIEQKGMLNHLYAKVMDLQLTDADRVAQNASQCFDISVWQYLAALLVGGCVHIFSDEVTLDPLQFLQQCHRSRISILEIVPSQLAVLIESIEENNLKHLYLKHLRWLISTGEALPPQLSRQWHALYPHIPILNAYGATECSDDVTHYPIYISPDASVAHTPVGSPIANMQQYVLDEHLQPVSPGIYGEVYFGGIGVGRGYCNDAVRTAEVFLPDPFSNIPGSRLYKTGDLGRYLEDGNLDFSRRIDSQVKFRGHRIELEEIEALLNLHPAVRQSIVMVREDRAEEKNLVAYVMPDTQYRGTSQRAEAEEVREHLQHWASIYDEIYLPEASLPKDLTGSSRVWISSYTGQPFSVEEVLDCIDDTLGRIRSLEPDRVLEIGAGSGQLLFRLAPLCTQYWATDLSREALHALESQIQIHNEPLPEIHLLHQAADDFKGLPLHSFDTVIINEVVQYFPTIEYLVSVIKGALQVIKPGGCIFIGGVRSLPLLEAFHTSVQLFQLPDALSIDHFKKQAQLKITQEKELAIDPRFFHRLRHYFAGISGVQLQMKGGHYHNEFTRFRYDAVLQIASEIQREDMQSLLDFQEQKLSISIVHQLLLEKRADVLRITHIPNPRLATEAGALQLLGGNHEEIATLGDLRKALLASSANDTGIDPENLVNLGQSLSYAVEVLWSEDEPCDYYEVTFKKRRVRTKDVGERPVVVPEKESQFPAWSSYANSPLVKNATGKLDVLLQRFLKEKLPAYMIPSSIVIMSFIPLTPNGKVDHKKLPMPTTMQYQFSETSIAPRDMLEFQLTRIFENVLGADSIDVTENFFNLGGHSLSAVRVITQIRKQLNCELPLSSLFRSPTVEHLASEIRQLDITPQPSSTLVALQDRGLKRPFFCIHPGGGGVTSYINLSRLLGTDQPFYGLQLPGLYREQKPYNRIEDLAAHYIKSIRTLQEHGPYLLGGWSMGGLVAFEMAHQLQVQGESVALLAIFDTWAPLAGRYPPLEEDAKLIADSLRIESTKIKPPFSVLSVSDIQALDPDEQIQYLLDIGKRVNSVPPDTGREEMRHFLNIHKANIQIEHNYQPEQGRSYPVTLFRAAEISPELMELMNEEIDFSNLTEEWDQLVSGPVEIYTIPGTHHTLMELPSVQTLAEQLTFCLNRVEEKYPFQTSAGM